MNESIELNDIEILRLLQCHLVLLFHCFGNLLQFFIPLISKFTDESFFNEFINWDSQLFSKATGVVTNIPAVIIYCGEIGVLFYPDWIEVARNRFFPIYFSFIVGFLNCSKVPLLCCRKSHRHSLLHQLKESPNLHLLP